MLPGRQCQVRVFCTKSHISNVTVNQDPRELTVKYTVCVTQQCNLACDYCYIDKRKAKMKLEVARKIIDFAFENTPASEDINIGLFGGEPLIEFALIKQIVELIESHPLFDAQRVQLMAVSNGTLFTNEIADYFNVHNIALGISCDGPPAIHDRFRKYANGKGSSNAVEKGIRKAVETLETPLVNAVYHPDTFRQLPTVVKYFSRLGLRNIYLNADYSAYWSQNDIVDIASVFSEIADLYVDYYRREDPHFISLIDSKIALILRNGYQENERCRMGKGEFAFTAEGRVYPCERLIGNGTGPAHCIGEVAHDMNIMPLNLPTGVSEKRNSECETCSLCDYCMNTCGCSNFFSTGSYNKVSAFQCASEKAAISASFRAFGAVETAIGPVFSEHLHGQPALNTAHQAQYTRAC